MQRHTSDIGTAQSALPGELPLALLERAGRAVRSDCGHAHDYLGADLNRLPGSAERSEVGSSEARLDCIEFDSGNVFAYWTVSIETAALLEP